jgi:methylmalonyl-CoA mutase N-terminal domain/subunit
LPEAEDLSSLIARWKKEVLEEHLEKRPERRDRFMTSSGIELAPAYFPTDNEDIDYKRDLGFPGLYPFTRGVYPNMYRGRLWTFRQYAGFGTCEETNRRFRYLLDKGQTGLSVAFDLPTQMGYDSDHPVSEGEVGRAGVAIDSVEDMERLFDRIPLDRVSTSMTINATAPVLLAMYIAVAEAGGVKRSALAGTVQNDLLKEYVARGTYIFPPEPSLKLTTDIFSFCSRELPRWNTISVSGYHIREAGATAAQEVAFTLANGMTYIAHAVQAGLEVDRFAPRMSFFFAAHNNLLEETAKFRAARKLWARMVRERFKAQDPRSWLLRFHTQTGGCTLTAQQPLNNVVRVALQALAAVLGGTQSLHTNSFDEALSLPTQEAVRVALRTQQIIAYESGVADVVDPLGGSYLVEYLTREIEKRVLDYLLEIEKRGGVIAAIKSGYINMEIERSAYEHQIEVERKSSIVVGVNEFKGEDEPVPIFRLDPSLESDQREKLASLKRRRSSGEAAGALRTLESAARSGENTLEPILEAVKSRCTLGEICDILRSVYGTYEGVERQ